MRDINTVFTFKNTSIHRGKYLLVKDLNTWNAIQYAQETYGDDIQAGYPLTKHDFYLMTKWKDGLYKECIGTVKFGRDIIKFHNLKCLEVVVL